MNFKQYSPGVRVLVFDNVVSHFFVMKVLPVLLFLGIWQFVSGTIVPAAILPPVTDVLSAAYSLAVHDVGFRRHFAITVFRGFSGIFLAIIIGTSLGLIMARNDFARRQIDPVVSVTYPSPKSPLIPIVVFWLGMGHASRITLAVIGAILPIVISAQNGARVVPQELLWSARSMGVGKYEEIAKIVLPTALPTLLTGIRIGMIASFIIVIQSEMIMARSGIGVLVIQYGELGLYSQLFGVVFWAVVLVGGLDRVYLRIANYLLRWSEQDAGGI